MPNTALIKVAFTPERVAAGLAYVREGWNDLRPLSDLGAAALVFGLIQREHRVRFAILAGNVCAWLLYVACVGGDIFPAARHLVPVVVLLTFALVEAMRRLEQRAMRWVPLALGLATCAVCALLWVDQPERDANRRAITERWEWEGEATGRLLQTTFGDSGAVVAVTAAGCIPYWSELDAIDMLGLNDRYLAEHPPPDIGHGMLGHEHGNGAYVLGRAPDLIVFDVGGGPSYRAGREMAATEAFARDYQPVRFEARSPRVHEGVFYLRRSSPRTGIRASSEGLVVPGYLLLTRTPTIIGARGGLVAAVARGERAFAKLDAPIPPGATFRIDSHPPDAARATIDPRHPQLLVVSTDREESVEIEQITIHPPP